ncbi:hypothetical protein Syun_028296 [Stephania yunnanensis]|uniref:Uncharacterized protein n=1 Tax=Stephania yunnanensis TaxID=152371 RepID=A0AAP0EH35_9MAGN
MELVKEVVPSTSIDDESSTSFNNHSSSLLAVAPTPNHQRGAAPPAIIEVKKGGGNIEKIITRLRANAGRLIRLEAKKKKLQICMLSKFTNSVAAELKASKFFWRSTFMD